MASAEVMSERVKHLQEIGRQMGAETLLTPADGIVITGYEMLTTRGNAEETFNSILNNEPGFKKWEGPQIGVPMYAPVAFDPDMQSDVLDRREERRSSFVESMTRWASIKALEKSGLIIKEEKGYRLPDGVNPNRVGVTLSSGIGSTANIITMRDLLWGEVDPEEYLDPKTTDEKKEELNETFRKNARSPQLLTIPFKTFPEQTPSGVTRVMESHGWSLNTSEACASGLSSIIEGARLIKEGHLDAVVAGGYEDIFTDIDRKGLGYADLGSFNAIGALSHAGISRPFDANRDGFIPASGAGVLVLERKDKAVQRGARPLAQVGGYSKRTDGQGRFEMHIPTVALTMHEALYDALTGEVRLPDLALLHATSTPAGDRREAHALKKATGDNLRHMKLVAPKEWLGHGRGAAGGWSAVVATQILEKGVTPPMRNLREIKLWNDPKDKLDEAYVQMEAGIESQLNFVTERPLEADVQTILVTAMGFGGYNAALTVRKYRP